MNYYIINQIKNKFAKLVSILRYDKKMPIFGLTEISSGAGGLEAAGKACLAGFFCDFYYLTVPS